MDVLTDKSKRAYAHISRYSSFPYYYNKKDKKYIYGVTAYLKDGAPYVLHSVVESDTLDALADHYYGRPDLYWIIADTNRIVDPTIKLFGKYKTLKVPTLSDITFKDE